MPHRTRLLLAGLALAAATLLPSPGSAAGDARLRLEVLVDGRARNEYPARGTTYIEAIRGREYSLRITNMEAVRVAVAVSVDGRNVIDAKRTSARDGRKWILEPWQTIVLEGWQVDGSQARRFYFTTEERSYAAWLGDVSNAGVIEAVAFREREPSWFSSRGGWWGRDDAPGSKDDDRWGEREEQAKRRNREAPLGAQAPGASADAARSQGPARESAHAQAKAEANVPVDASDEAAATGIGRHVDNEITTIRFEHESSPSSSARVRYGYREELVQLGVLPPPHRPDPGRREHARGFVGGFCPSP